MSTTSRPTDIDAVRSALAAEYDILEEIGRGGMAVVYRARERELDREVAIKVLPAQFVFDESFVERFQREGRIAAQLEHPNVVPIHRVGRRGDVVYLAMKLLRGQTLSDRILSRGRLDAHEIRRILVETATALAYAAKRGVVHRDIKPDNIMLDEDGRCIVTDFGIARSAAESKLTATGTSVGTPRYMSPEQARAKELDGRSDIYSLGVVGYECLTGTTPFQGDDAFAILMAHINDPVPRPPLKTPEERELYRVVERMLAKDPRDRFQSAEEVVAVLGAPSATADATAAGWSAGVTRTVVAAGIGTDPTLPGVAATRGFGARLRAVLPNMARRHAAARHWLGARTRGFWMTTAAAGVGVVTLYYGLHFATKHRSRCPVPSTVATAPAGGSAGALSVKDTPPRAQPFSVLIDAVRARRPGGSLDLYYDVCGLQDGTSYTASLTVSRNESGFKRLLGRSVAPVMLTANGRADGPAERHHETIDFDDMPPGSYTVDLAVTDASDRKRTKSTSFQVLTQ